MSSIDFNDRVVIVTGAGRGLGRSYAEALARRGATLVVHDAGVDADGLGDDPSVGESVAAQLPNALPCATNLETRGGCEEVVRLGIATFGRLAKTCAAGSQRRESGRRNRRPLSRGPSGLARFWLRPGRGAWPPSALVLVRGLDRDARK